MAVLHDDLSLAVTRVADLGRRDPPRLTVALGDLEDLRLDGDRLAATIRHGRREWTVGDETVYVEPRGTSATVLAALGHRARGHACPDCGPADAPEAA